MEDLKESIAEVSEMEQIRIECEYPRRGAAFPSPFSPFRVPSAAPQLRQTAADEAGEAFF